MNYSWYKTYLLNHELFMNYSWVIHGLKYCFPEIHNHELFMSKTWTIHGIKPICWTMNYSWYKTYLLNHELFMNYSWVIHGLKYCFPEIHNHELFMSKPWTIHGINLFAEPWTIHELFMSNPWFKILSALARNNNELFMDNSLISQITKVPMKYSWIIHG